MEVKNGDFGEKLKLLVDNLKNINSGFEKNKNREEKLYIIKYYLNE